MSPPPPDTHEAPPDLTPTEPSDAKTNGAHGPSPTDWRKLAPVGVLGGIAVALPPIGGFVLLGTMPWIAEWLQSHVPTGLVLYVVGFMLLAGLAILPTYSQAILAGFAFGLPLGTPAALMGFTGAACLAFFVARRAAGDRLAEAVDGNPRLGTLRHALLQGNFWRVLGMVTLLRIPPNSPFALTNLAFAGLKVPFPAFVLGTLIGMTPRTVVAVYLGAGLSEFNLDDLGSNWPLIAGFIATAIVVVIVSLLAKRVLDQVTPAPPAEAPTEQSSTE